MHPSTRSLCSLAQGDSLHLNLRKVKTYHYPPFHIVTRVHFDLFFPRNPGRDDLFIDLLSELLLVVVRFENKVIVSEWRPAATSRTMNPSEPKAHAPPRRGPSDWRRRARGVYPAMAGLA